MGCLRGGARGDELKLPAARTRSRVCNNVLLRLTSVPPLPGGLACTVSAQGDRGFTPDPFSHKLQGSKSVSLSPELPVLVRAPDPIRSKALTCGLVWQYVNKVLTCGWVWQYALSLNLYILCCTRRLEREKQARAAAASEAQERAQMRYVAAQVRILPCSQDEGIYHQDVSSQVLTLATSIFHLNVLLLKRAVLPICLFQCRCLHEVRCAGDGPYTQDRNSCRKRTLRQASPGHIMIFPTNAGELAGAKQSQPAPAHTLKNIVLAYMLQGAGTLGIMILATQQLQLQLP